jgi:hypothetical protein
MPAVNWQARLPLFLVNTKLREAKIRSGTHLYMRSCVSGKSQYLLVEKIQDP